MLEINMQLIRDTLPKRGTCVLGKENSNCFIECKVYSPSLSDKNFKMVKNWQRQIVGDALSEFYTFTEGSHWKIWLKRVPINFVNTTTEDTKNWLEKGS